MAEHTKNGIHELAVLYWIRVIDIVQSAFLLPVLSAEIVVVVDVTVILSPRESLLLLRDYPKIEYLIFILLFLD